MLNSNIVLQNNVRWEQKFHERIFHVGSVYEARDCCFSGECKGCNFVVTKCKFRVAITVAAVWKNGLLVEQLGENSYIRNFTRFTLFHFSIGRSTIKFWKIEIIITELDSGIWRSKITFSANIGNQAEERSIQKTYWIQ